MKELTASEITAIAIKYFTNQNARVRRVNNVGAYKKRAFQVKSGFPDIQGYSEHGTVLMCEVKKIGDRIRKEQDEVLADVKACGGLAYIATQDPITGNVTIKVY